MKLRFVNIIFLLAGISAAILVFYGLRGRRQFNDKVTLSRKDRIPYGTEVAYRVLPELFPGAHISTSRSMPGYWDSISMNEGHQALICITPNFQPDEFEMNKLVDFVKAGNDVFLSTFEINYVAEGALLRYREEYTVDYLPANGFGDSLSLTLLYPGRKTWVYPGVSRSHVFTRLDTSRALILGEERGVPDFIQLNAGKGRFFLHRAPIAFSNYFLLHKQNFEYYERLISFLSPGIDRIVWDEYFINRRPKQETKQSWFSVLMRYPGLSTAVIIGILTLLIYALAEMRRKQRIIPVHKRPVNDSMDFVKTIGRLYFEKGDHLNLARKMASYFLEHVRSRYKIATSVLDDKFVTALQFKSGIDLLLIRSIIDDINQLEQPLSMSAGQLTNFFNKLETFYTTA